MFAYIGIIFPILIGVDYYIDPLKIDEIVINKHHEHVYGKIVYRVFTDSHHFSSDYYFYKHTEIGDIITFHSTPIFNTITSVTKRTDGAVYNCSIDSIYGMLLILVCLTLVISIIVIIKTWGWIKKQKRIIFNLTVNLGLVNAVLCMMTLLAILFHM